MTDQNGKPPPDPSLLTPNDWRRLRVALHGKSPQEILDGGEIEDIYQLLILSYRLRDDVTYTWEQAGDVAPTDVFSFGDQAGQSPPAPPAATPTANGGSPASSTAPTSKKKPTGSARGRSSASSSA